MNVQFAVISLSSSPLLTLTYCFENSVPSHVINQAKSRSLSLNTDAAQKLVREDAPGSLWEYQERMGACFLPALSIP